MMLRGKRSVYTQILRCVYTCVYVDRSVRVKIIRDRISRERDYSVLSFKTCGKLFLLVDILL